MKTLTPPQLAKLNDAVEELLEAMEIEDGPLNRKIRSRILYDAQACDMTFEETMEKIEETTDATREIIRLGEGEELEKEVRDLCNEMGV